MKRKCKNVDITDLDFIKRKIHDCLQGKKKTRNDIVRLYEQYENDDNLALEVQKELIEEKLVLKPIWYKEKYDNASQKLRRIGIQDIKQQIYDYIAVGGLEELLKRVGTYQCASIKKRGQIYGKNAIKRWVDEYSNGKHTVKYAVKMDIRHYYESIDRKLIIEWLDKRVNNPKLMWLISELLSTFEKGLSIGSYLSQHLANLYISDLYYELESLAKERHKKDKTIVRKKMVNHVLFYMDDLALFGSNSRDLIKATEFAIYYLQSKKGLDIKPTWQLINFEYEFIDMMGFRISRNCVTIRRRTFKKLNRAYIRFKHDPHNVAIAKRIISYGGFLKYSDSYKYCHKLNTYALDKCARKVVSKYEKSKNSNISAKSDNQRYRWQVLCVPLFE